MHVPARSQYRQQPGYPALKNSRREVPRDEPTFRPDLSANGTRLHRKGHLHGFSHGVMSNIDTTSSFNLRARKGAMLYDDVDSDYDSAFTFRDRDGFGDLSLPKLPDVSLTADDSHMLPSQHKGLDGEEDDTGLKRIKGSPVPRNLDGTGHSNLFHISRDHGLQDLAYFLRTTGPPASASENARAPSFPVTSTIHETELSRAKHGLKEISKLLRLGQKHRHSSTAETKQSIASLLRDEGNLLSPAEKAGLPPAVEQKTSTSGTRYLALKISQDVSSLDGPWQVSLDDPSHTMTEYCLPSRFSSDLLDDASWSGGPKSMRPQEAVAKLISTIRKRPDIDQDRVKELSPSTSGLGDRTSSEDDDSIDEVKRSWSPPQAFPHAVKKPMQLLEYNVSTQHSKPVSRPEARPPKRVDSPVPYDLHQGPSPTPSHVDRSVEPQQSQDQVDPQQVKPQYKFNQVVPHSRRIKSAASSVYSQEGVTTARSVHQQARTNLGRQMTMGNEYYRLVNGEMMTPHGPVNPAVFDRSQSARTSIEPSQIANVLRARPPSTKQRNHEYKSTSPRLPPLTEDERQRHSDEPGKETSITRGIDKVVYDSAKETPRNMAKPELKVSIPPRRGQVPRMTSHTPKNSGSSTASANTWSNSTDGVTSELTPATTIDSLPSRKTIPQKRSTTPHIHNEKQTTTPSPTQMCFSPVMTITEERPKTPKPSPPRVTKPNTKEVRTHYPRPRSLAITDGLTRPTRHHFSHSRPESPTTGGSDADRDKPLPTPPRSSTMLPPVPLLSPPPTRALPPTPSVEPEVTPAPTSAPLPQLPHATPAAQRSSPPSSHHREVCNSSRMSNRSLRHEDRIESLEKQNALLSAALMAVLSTNGALKGPLADVADSDAIRSPPTGMSWNSSPSLSRQFEGIQSIGSETSAAALGMYLNARRQG